MVRKSGTSRLWGPAARVANQAAKPRGARRQAAANWGARGHRWGGRPTAGGALCTVGLPAPARIIPRGAGGTGRGRQVQGRPGHQRPRAAASAAGPARPKAAPHGVAIHGRSAARRASNRAGLQGTRSRRCGRSGRARGARGSSRRAKRPAAPSKDEGAIGRDGANAQTVGHNRAGGRQHPSVQGGARARALAPRLPALPNAR